MIEGKVFCHGSSIPEAYEEASSSAIKLEDSTYMKGLVQKSEGSTSAARDPEAKMFTQKRAHDPVNHPSHYTQGPMQVIDIIEQYGFCDDFRLGNCVKYLFRYKLKGTALEDLKKARWYLDRKIASMEQEKP